METTIESVHNFTRRRFLQSSACAIAWPLAAADAPPLINDVGPLKRVVLHRPGPEMRRFLGFMGRGANDSSVAEHRALEAALKAAGAETLFIDDLIDQAIAAARPGGHFRTWLKARIPALAPMEQRVTASTLLGAADDAIYRFDAEGNFAPLVQPHGSIVFTRDSAVMTPRGAVMCHFLNEGRSIESALVRFTFDWCPALKRYPVVFDAVEEGLTLEGGDLMVADERTLFLGVGNRSNPAVARRLAMRLEMDVVAVQMPSGGSSKLWNDPSRTPAHNAFLHLDTICCFVDKKTIVTLPYLLEKKLAGSDPLSKILRGMAKLPGTNESQIERMLKAIEPLGQVKKYKAGSGDVDPSGDGMKLVDYLRAQGFKIIFAGGNPPEADPVAQAKFMSEQVMREVANQGANVVATSPGQVIAYDGNPHTTSALRDAGIRVTTFPGEALGAWNGGPHCLTMPLERG